MEGERERGDKGKGTGGAEVGCRDKSRNVKKTRIQ